MFSDISNKTFDSSSPDLWSSLPEGLTLEKILHNQTPPPFSLQEFSDYLKSIYCIENLLFYQAVNQYQSNCDLYFKNTNFDFSDLSAHLLVPQQQVHFRFIRQQFQHILQNFVQIDAPHEINIPYEVRHQLLDLHQTQKLYHPALLHPASNAVVELLRINAFIPFATDISRIKPFNSKRKKSAPSLKILPDTAEVSLLSPGFLKKITTPFRMRSFDSPSFTNK
ncbi:RGS domain-containing protein [Gilbertella persicaria]|uniref:RGS domain-containing protein n=1 Tax=Gilbertella persicaria TaxID=101096 RepID=UPI00221EB8C0|nr:RGS domain-containing protein [Gilbertella persicaria]KAI8085758.1 RGS domain-containing protein [Gilbertella persicaria]